MGKVIEVDVDALNAAFCSSFDERKTDLVNKAQAQSGEIAAFAAIDIHDHAEKFCDAWPKIRPMIKLALRGLSLIYPAQVAMVQAGLNALDQEVIGKVCEAD